MSYFITDNNISGLDTVALEDSIMQRDKPATAGSSILKGFISPYNATVVERLLKNGKKIAGKTNMDEFGIAGIFASQPEAVSGAVKAVIDGAAGYSLCNDLFGKYRKQAAENGCCYIHPTYGTVSRYGLIPLASSMDQIGIVCKDIRDGFTLLSVIAGNDEKDGAMFPKEKHDGDKIYNSSALTGEHPHGEFSPQCIKNIRIGIPQAIVGKSDIKAQESIASFANSFTSCKIDIEYFDIFKQVMFILSSAEISNNLSCYDGIKFGFRASGYKGLNQLYTKTRTEGLGLDAKLTAIMGAMVLSQDNYTVYYEKAMRLRRLIKDSLRFDEYDIILLPCKISGEPYENLSLYSLTALAGLPSISFGYKDSAIQLVSDVKKESLLLAAWEVCQA